MSTMKLRSGRLLMRRDSRNLEEFQERRRYQAEQKKSKPRSMMMKKKQLR